VDDHVVIVLVSLCLFSAFNTDKMNNHESLEYSSSATLIGKNGKPNNLKAKVPKQDYGRLNIVIGHSSLMFDSCGSFKYIY
jgi:hypothetical protein